MRYQRFGACFIAALAIARSFVSAHIVDQDSLSRGTRLYRHDDQHLLARAPMQEGRKIEKIEKAVLDIFYCRTDLTRVYHEQWKEATEAQINLPFMSQKWWKAYVNTKRKWLSLGKQILTELEQVLKQRHLETTEPWMSLKSLALRKVKVTQRVFETVRKFEEDRPSTMSSQHQSLINVNKKLKKFYQEDKQRLESILSHRQPLPPTLSEYLRGWLNAIPNEIKEVDSEMKFLQQRLSGLKISNSEKSSETQHLLSDSEHFSADSDSSSHGSMSPPRKGSQQSITEVGTTKDILRQGSITGASGPVRPQASPGSPKQGPQRQGSGTGRNTVGSPRQGSPDNQPGNKVAHASSMGKGMGTSFHDEEVRIAIPPGAERELIQSSNVVNQPGWCQKIVDLVKNKELQQAVIACGLYGGGTITLAGLATQHRPVQQAGAGITLVGLCFQFVAKCNELSEKYKADRAQKLHPHRRDVDLALASHVLLV